MQCVFWHSLHSFWSWTHSPNRKKFWMFSHHFYGAGNSGFLKVFIPLPFSQQHVHWDWWLRLPSPPQLPSGQCSHWGQACNCLLQIYGKIQGTETCTAELWPLVSTELTQKTLFCILKMTEGRSPRKLTHFMLSGLFQSLITIIIIILIVAPYTRQHIQKILNKTISNMFFVHRKGGLDFFRVSIWDMSYSAF